MLVVLRYVKKESFASERPTFEGCSFKSKSITMKSIIFFCLILAIGFISCQEPSNPIQRKPEYTLTQDSIKVDVYSYEAFESFWKADNDTTYVVNFWATWCRPCVEELPYFEELYQNYKDKKVRLILVSLDFEDQIKSKLMPFLEEKKLQGEVLVLGQKGMNEWIDKVDSTWSGALPATVIFNKTKRNFYERQFNYLELEQELKQFLLL